MRERLLKVQGRSRRGIRSSQRRVARPEKSPGKKKTEGTSESRTSVRRLSIQSVIAPRLNQSALAGDHACSRRTIQRLTEQREASACRFARVVCKPLRPNSFRWNADGTAGCDCRERSSFKKNAARATPDRVRISTAKIASPTRVIVRRSAHLSSSYSRRARALFFVDHFSRSRKRAA